MAKPTKPDEPVRWHRLSRRRDLRIALMLAVGLFFTANAYLTATGASGLTKLGNNPFDFGPAAAPTAYAGPPLGLN